MKKEFKDSVVTNWRKAKSWARWHWYSHRDEITMVSTIVVPIVLTVVHEISNDAKSRKQEYLRSCTDYDPSTGWRNELTRPLSRMDKENILAYRKLTGANQTEALLHFGLLKK